MLRLKAVISLALVLALLAGSGLAANDQTYRNPRSQQIDIYVTSWCPYCKMAEAYLDQQGVEYRRFDVEKDKAAARRMYSLAGSGGIPFAVINGVKIKGWSEEAYAAALKKNE